MDISDWERHLYHLICGQWAWKNCAVCQMQDVQRGIASQLHTLPLPADGGQGPGRVSLPGTAS